MGELETRGVMLIHYKEIKTKDNPGWKTLWQQLLHDLYEQESELKQFEPPWTYIEREKSGSSGSDFTMTRDCVNISALAARGFEVDANVALEKGGDKKYVIKKLLGADALLDILGTGRKQGKQDDTSIKVLYTELTDDWAVGWGMERRSSLEAPLAMLQSRSH